MTPLLPLATWLVAVLLALAAERTGRQALCDALLALWLLAAVAATVWALASTVPAALTREPVRDEWGNVREMGEWHADPTEGRAL